MAKDSKKEKNIEPKLSPKDKDIHLNIVGVPKKNVDVKKTHPRQNDEDYQLYRISIDTKGKHKEKERKRRLSSLEPAPKTTKTRQRPKNIDNVELSSDDSYMNIPRPKSPRTPLFGHKKKESTPKLRRKESVDKEVCFTIPGEKGKAIRIVGSSAIPHDDDTSRDSSSQRSKRKSTESPRQVGFAKLDAVYGSDVEETSIESPDSSPYRQTSPQVYKVENISPNEAFKDPNGNRGYDGKIGQTTSKPNLQSSRTGSPSENSSKQRNNNQPENRVSPGSHKSDYDKPSTSKAGVQEEPESPQSKKPGDFRSHTANTDGTSSNFPNTSNLSSDLNTTSESKGKYPYYPYDQQKRGKPPSKQFQDPKEDKDPYMYPKLPSIPEVRSTTEQDPSPYQPNPPGEGRSTKESSVLTEPMNRFKEAKVNADAVPKDNNGTTKQSSSKPLRKNDEYKNPTDPRGSSPQNPNEPIKAYPIKVQTNDPNKLSQLSPSNPQPGTIGYKPVNFDSPRSSQMQRLPPTNTQRLSSGRIPLLNDTTKLNQTQISPQKISQSNSPMSSRVPRQSVNSAVNYNVQNTSSKPEPLSTNKRDLSNKPQGPTTGVRSITSPPLESSVYKLRNGENTRDPAFKNAQDALNKKLPIVIKRPETSDIEIQTEGPLKPKERIMLEIQEELSKKSSPFSQKSIQDPVKRNVSSDGKDAKHTKSKLSSFVSAIPKPSFKRNKSQEKKNTENSVISGKTQSNSNENPKVTTHKGNVKNEAKKPVEELGLVKKVHQPAVEAYPAWVTSPNQEPDNKSNGQPQSNKDDQMSGRSAPKNYPAIATSPDQRRPENSWDEGQPQSNKDDQMIGRNAPKNYPAIAASPDQRRPENSWDEGQLQSYKDDQISGGNAPKNYPAIAASPDQRRPENSWDEGQPQSYKDNQISGRNAPKNYPAIAASPDQRQPEDRWDEVQPQSNKDGPLSGRNPPKGYSDDFVPYGVDDLTPSVELANKSYGEHPLARGAGTSPTVSEKMNRSEVPAEEEVPPDYVQGQREMVKGVDSDTWSLLHTDKRDYPQGGSIQDDSERGKEPQYSNYDQNKLPFLGPNVVAYPGQLNEQTPFGYQPQFSADPKAESQALASLENDFDAYKRQKKDKRDPSMQLVDRNPSLVSRASRNTEEQLKKKLYGYPIQVMKGSIDSQLIPVNYTPMELSNGSNKNKPLQQLVNETGKNVDQKSLVSKENTSGTNPTTTSLYDSDVKVKPLVESPFGGKVAEQVYPANVPANTTYGVFRPKDAKNELGPNQEKSKPKTERQGPKGILIFVNKKNKTEAPFEKHRPSPRAEDYLRRPKTNPGPKKKNRRVSSSAGDTSSSSVAPGSSSYGAGDDTNSVVERTSSGRRITQRFPCGCVRIITSAPENQLKKEELISAYCKDGSRCEVSRAQRSMLGRSLDSSSWSWNPESSSAEVLPELEVIADGIVSRKPISPRPPAPTMNGAKLTGSFKIKSNRVNGVCNLYLDRKLKNYLRNNLDKIKLLLEDDKSR